MAIRLLLLLILATALMAKESPRTMATRRIVSAQAFSDKRAKAMDSIKRKKKIRKNSLPKPKSHWGPPKTRHK
ncbi:MAG: hypothetical protein K2X03_10105 [Bryobacteraceae bacterium]|nr:hypothetical protein [Bryobacteraceae bacterium]